MKKTYQQPMIERHQVKTESLLITDTKGWIDENDIGANRLGLAFDVEEESDDENQRPQLWDEEFDPQQ